MAGPARVRLSVKNTFLDADLGEDAPQRGGRPRSLPPAVGRGRHGEDSSGFVEQLARLGAIVQGTEKPRGLAPGSPASDASTAPSPAARAFRWSSCDSDVDGGSPAAAAPLARGLHYPSVGSAGHAAGACRPCAFERSPAGCKFGADCSFCHVISEHPETVRMRPCKGKRERFKRTLAAIEGKIAENPDLLSSGGLCLPAFVDRNPQARARVMAQLAQVAAGAYRGAATEAQ